MLNNLSLVKKVLTYVSEHEEVKLDQTVIDCKTGFNRLAEEGYLKIQEKDGEYIATITAKGLRALEN